MNRVRWKHKWTPEVNIQSEKPSVRGDPAGVQLFINFPSPGKLQLYIYSIISKHFNTGTGGSLLLVAEEVFYGGCYVNETTQYLFFASNHWKN